MSFLDTLTQVHAQYGPPQVKTAEAVYLYSMVKQARMTEALGAQFVKTAQSFGRDPWEMAFEVAHRLGGLEKMAGDNPLAQFYMDWALGMEKEARLGRKGFKILKGTKAPTPAPLPVSKAQTAISGPGVSRAAPRKQPAPGPQQTAVQRPAPKPAQQPAQQRPSPQPQTAPARPKYREPLRDPRQSVIPQQSVEEARQARNLQKAKNRSNRKSLTPQQLAERRAKHLRGGGGAPTPVPTQAGKEWTPRQKKLRDAQARAKDAIAKQKAEAQAAWTPEVQQQHVDKLNKQRAAKVKQRAAEEAAAAAPAGPSIRDKLVGGGLLGGVGLLGANAMMGGEQSQQGQVPQGYAPQGYYR